MARLIKLQLNQGGETSPGIDNKDRQVSGKWEQKVTSNSSYECYPGSLKPCSDQVQQIELHESGDCPCILNHPGSSRKDALKAST